MSVHIVPCVPRVPRVPRLPCVPCVHEYFHQCCTLPNDFKLH